jgi:hypothetical protein
MLCIDELKVVVPECIKCQLEFDFVVTNFLQIIEEVYTTTNDTDTEIRRVLVDIAVSKMDALVESGDFKRLMEGFGEFSSALVIAIHRKYYTPRINIVETPIRRIARRT